MCVFLVCSKIYLLCGSDLRADATMIQPQAYGEFTAIEGVDPTCHRTSMTQGEFRT